MIFYLTSTTFTEQFSMIWRPSSLNTADKASERQTQLVQEVTRDFTDCTRYVRIVMATEGGVTIVYHGQSWAYN